MTEETKSEETKTEEMTSKQTESDDESKTVHDEPKVDEKKPDEPKKKVAAKPTSKPLGRPSTNAGRGWRPSWYRVGMGDLFIGVALLIAGTVVAMRTPTRWYGAFIVGTIETIHGLYLLSKKQS